VIPLLFAPTAAPPPPPAPADLLLGANYNEFPDPVLYRDGRGNPPNLGILSFPIPSSLVVASQSSSLSLTTINIYLKEAGPTYTLLESKGVHGVEDSLEYYYMMLTAVHGESYAVNWTMPSGTVTPATQVDATVYFPPIPDPERVHTNAAMLVMEHVRRVFLVERQHGGRVILLQRKTSGTDCVCFNHTTGDAQRDCSRCYGTGFLGGFTVFPRLLMRFIPAGTRLNDTEDGILVDSSPRGHTPIVPEVTDRDMVIRALPGGRLRAYEIHNIQRGTMEGPADIPVIQEFSLKLMEAHERIYRAVTELIPSTLLPVETGTQPGLPVRW
jgi:hypothetical protein